MAKKKGRKLIECPKCKKPTATRGGKCAVCDTVKPDAPKITRTKAKGKGDLETAIVLVKGLGGLKGLKKALDEYAKVAKPIDELGGVKEAQSVLERLEEIKAL